MIPGDRTFLDIVAHQRKEEAFWGNSTEKEKETAWEAVHSPVQDELHWVPALRASRIH